MRSVEWHLALMCINPLIERTCNRDHPFRTSPGESTPVAVSPPPLSHVGPHAAALRSHDVVHQREDALALGCIDWDEQRDGNEAQCQRILVALEDQHASPKGMMLERSYGEIAELLLHSLQRLARLEKAIEGIVERLDIVFILRSTNYRACSSDLARRYGR
eukprot:4546716-Prymnesium_polylepis.1